MNLSLKILLLFIILMQDINISAQLKNVQDENQNSKYKLDSRSDFSVSAYIQKGNIQKITKSSFKYITDVIYFGIDVDSMGNIDIQNAKKDFFLLDSLSDENPVNKSVCFGGWGRSDFFVNLSSSENNRNNFCEQVLKLGKKHNLKAIDIDWEFPKNKKLKDGFVALIKSLHETLNPHNIKISIAVGFWRKQAKLCARVEPYIYAVNLMLYDNFSPTKGHASLTLVRRTCKRFVQMGIPAQKLMVGVPFYGRHRWKHSKTLTYNKVPEPRKNISKKGIYKGYFFDVPNTLKPKIEYIKNTKKAGIMIWELSQDFASDNDNSLLKYIWFRINA